VVPGAKLREFMQGQANVMQETEGVAPFQSIAMAIEGTAEPAASPQDGEEAPPTTTRALKVVYVADADIMLPDFSMIRADPNTMTETRFQFQNITFVLNCIDWLSGELDFIEVRKHEPIIASLRMIDSVKELAREDVRKGSEKFQEIYDGVVTEARESMDKQLQSLREEVEELQKKNADGSVERAELQAKVQGFQMSQEAQQRKLDVKIAKTARDRQLSVREIERKAADEVTSIQNQVKFAAVALPCIPPLIVGVIVFASRRLRERENISKSRLK
jgi:ABC-2 type transport system permease protein